MLKDRQQFIEGLNKSIQKDFDIKKEELEKVRNMGGGNNDATGNTLAHKAWTEKKLAMEKETDRLQELADAKAHEPKHGIHQTLQRHLEEYEKHLKNKPK